MIFNEILNYLSILLIPIVILLSINVMTVLSVYYYKLMLQRLPDRQRAEVEQIAKLAVHSIEQQYTYADGVAKKNVAVNLTSRLFDAFNLPIPAQTLIDAAIEAAVFEMNLYQLGPDDTMPKLAVPRPTPPTTLPPSPPPTTLPKPPSTPQPNTTTEPPLQG